MSKVTRRDFIGKSIRASSLTLAAGAFACQHSEKFFTLPTSAPDGPTLKAGLIGCGSRGSGAAINFLEAGPSLEIIALGDIFEDKLNKCRLNLKNEKGIEIDSEKCFVGIDAFEKVIDTGVDIVLLATPPYFRPQHFEAAIKAGKHVFMEKPIAVDPVGVRSIMINGLRAQEKGLSVVTGTIKRHQVDYLATHEKIKQGAIGEITSGNCYYNQGKLWHVNPQSQWSELEAMIRNWVNWTWLSGDHIVEQHIHNLDLMNWHINSHPIKATGFGSRQRRTTGDQYDNFSVDYVYPNQVHVHSMCRQINGCSTNVSDQLRGTHGYTNCENTIYNPQGQVRWKYPLNEEQKNDRWHFFWRAFIQEHVDFVTAIRTQQHINETQHIAESTLTAIMGRMSAYTGKEVTWDEMLNSELKLGPKHFVMGNVNIDKSIPKPGM
ncbi:Gfo/Idh/MocA family protein [Carboxylicivirga sp. M1479]|uniref:Gfo/Idh/MocA family protein n=1 Tax=Carboxylicivirga sp. M1479 TaxID=2594476 RepID=UPI001177A8C5|nr:Gfo/Idh/MocA family oxidoreductase [Carboxylicivirga sp. M1479]TRX66487.1 Gfo/Idh/MocA family oxidoreductase [Carboxylicivirga sp. M1479]